MKTLAVIQGCPVVQHDDGSLTFTAPAMIDGDGRGPSHGDPDYQPDTSLHDDGEPLNSDADRYVVVPPQIRDGVPGVVLGCQARVVNTRTGRATDAVVGDIGPKSKLGEISIATARAIGVPASPTTGGEEQRVIAYTIWPGKPAIVCGKSYALTAVG